MAAELLLIDVENSVVRPLPPTLEREVRIVFRDAVAREVAKQLKKKL